MVMAYALTPRDMATSIRGDTVTDGPFVDSKEVIAGFYVIEAPDLDAALAQQALHARQARATSRAGPLTQPFGCHNMATFQLLFSGGCHGVS
jgi:hypothetical protein